MQVIHVCNGFVVFKVDKVHIHGQLLHCIHLTSDLSFRTVRGPVESSKRNNLYVGVLQESSGGFWKQRGILLLLSSLVILNQGIFISLSKFISWDLTSAVVHWTDWFLFSGADLNQGPQCKYRHFIYYEKPPWRTLWPHCLSSTFVSKLNF